MSRKIGKAGQNHKAKSNSVLALRHKSFIMSCFFKRCDKYCVVVVVVVVVVVFTEVFLPVLLHVLNRKNNSDDYK